MLLAPRPRRKCRSWRWTAWDMAGSRYWGQGLSWRLRTDDRGFVLVQGNYKWCSSDGFGDYDGWFLPSWGIQQGSLGILETRGTFATCAQRVEGPIIISRFGIPNRFNRCLSLSVIIFQFMLGFRRMTNLCFFCRKLYNYIWDALAGTERLMWQARSFGGYS